MKKYSLFLLLSLLLLAACTKNKGQQTKPIANQDSSSQLAASPTPTTTTSATTSPDATTTITILYTNDEHGWMSGKKEGMGAANLLGLWRTRLGYKPHGNHFILLSGGDNWTGPAISSWFKGESMVEVLNAMGYDASAVGNHEFDFGLDVLQERATQANYPYLAANLVRKSDGAIPEDLGVKPYAILTKNGIKIGIVGLSNTETPKVTNPAHVGGFRFEPYVNTLQKIIPQVRAHGADVILVTSHLCNEEVRAVAQNTRDLDIALIGGGHCHQRLSEKSGNTILLASGSYFQAYGWATLTIDQTTKQIVKSDYGVEDNNGGRADKEVASIVEKWQKRTDEALSEPIGYLARTIPQRSKSMQTLTTETWLWGYPNADAALTNLGGMRDDFPAGELTLANIISVMPFDNVLINVKLTGSQLEQIISEQEGRVAIGGIHRKGLGWVLNRTGQSLEKNVTYHVLVNDFMYAGGDDYDLLAQADPHAYNTSIDWRQPLIDWIIAQNSTPEHPLDNAISKLGEQ